MTSLRTPPFLLGAALLFWGWHSGLLLVGALMAVILEASRVVGLRWDPSDKEFGRLWDFSATLSVGVLIYLFASSEGPSALAGFFAQISPATEGKLMQQTSQAMLVWFRRMPMVFFLFVAAQVYSPRQTLPWSVFSYVIRRKLARKQLAPPPPGEGLNTAWPYFAICLLGACITVKMEQREWFFAGLAPLIAWALWCHRSKRFAVEVWAALLLLTLALGFLGQRGYIALSNWANMSSANWLVQFMRGGTDPKESRTAIGQIGRLKLSGKIVLRVEPKDNHPVPPLLREASYRLFKSPDWVGAGKLRDFGNLAYDTNQTTWEVVPGKPASNVVTIAQYLRGRGEVARRGLLAVPQGIVRMEKLAAYVVSTNTLGVVRVDEGQGLVIYDAWFTEGSTIDMPPDADDRNVPGKEKAAVAEIAGQLNLGSQSTKEVLRTVSRFFQDNFQYSEWLPSSHRPGTNLTPLAHFLLQERKGHCEYFATAAALLLREGGVPARYAVGYSVQEKSGRKFIVRERHAHAWCLAWVDGAWRDFDVTPGSWGDTENAHASWFESVTDGWSRLWFEFSKLRWGLTAWRKYLLWIFMPVLLVLLVRLFLGKKWKRLRADRQRLADATLWPGLDSEFYRLESELQKRGLPRPANETLLDWLERVQNDPLLATVREPLDNILHLHYRHRFDPAGLDADERAMLRAEVQECLKRLQSKP